MYTKESKMDESRINFDAIPWEVPMAGVRMKAVKRDGKQIRLVEFTKDFVEPDWCEKGHVGYIMEGKLEINFDGRVEVYNPGDALVIPEGEAHKHMAMAVTDVVRLFLVESV